MGDDFADEVAAGGLHVDGEKLASAAAGIRPYARDKAAAATGLTREEMQHLASLYGA